MKCIYLIALAVGFLSCGDEDRTKDLGDQNDTLQYVKKDTAVPVNPYKDARIEVLTYDNKSLGNNIPGFGSDIQIDGKLYIHQPHMPAVPGNNGFASVEKAKKAGELIAYKIRHHIM